MSRIENTGGTNSRAFWSLRKQCLSNADVERIDTINIDGKPHTSPQIVKEENAAYFENLYRSHQSVNFDKSWTQHLDKCIADFTKNMNHEENPMNSNIQPDEVKQALKSMMNNKSPSFENIPNELLKQAGPELTTTLTDLFNEIMAQEDIPEQWKHGEITPLYKGAGSKNEPHNYRGITVGSNIEKLFERVLNNRVQKHLPFTEAQAGGRPERSTIDQLFILQTLMQRAQATKTPLYLAFLDIQKAYDKAWMSAILYTLCKNGIKGKIWRIIKSLNTDLTSQVKTKYGLTRIITMKTALRQGGVLSGTEFAKMVDEMCECLIKTDLGATYGHQRVPALLLMDDIVLMADAPQKLQQMLQIVNHQANLYHVKFGANKCRIMVVREPTNQQQQWYMGPEQMQQTPDYKYLGQIISKDSSLTNHIKAKEREMAAAQSSIASVTSHEVISKLNLASPLKIIEACMLPGLLYASEAWLTSKEDISKLQMIQNNIIRKAIGLPKSTPICAIQMETAILPITAMINQRQLNYLWSVMNRETHKTHDIIKAQELHKDTPTWMQNIRETLQKYGLQIESCTHMSKNQWKRLVRQTIKDTHHHEIYRECTSKPKTANMASRKKVPRREEYLIKLPRSTSNVILRARCDMLQIKEHQKYQWKQNTSCRLCQWKEETLQHLLSDCPITGDLREKGQPDPEQLYGTLDEASRIGRILTVIEERLASFE